MLGRLEDQGVRQGRGSEEGDRLIARRRGHSNPARRRYLRAFLIWFEVTRPGFLLAPRVIRRREDSLHLAFEGLTRHIVVEIWERSVPLCGPRRRGRNPQLIGRDRDYVFAVYVEPWPHSRIDNANCLHGHNFEWLLDGRGDVSSPPPGWTGSRRAHREAVWRERLFEPFLLWVNEELANADAIVVARAESQRCWIMVETEEEGPLPRPTTEPGHDLHHYAYLARSGDPLSGGNPELEETIEYLEFVALRDGEAYGRARDGTLARIEAAPMGVA